MKRLLFTLALTFFGPWNAAAADLAPALCGTLVQRVNEVPGDGPLFLRSYDGEGGAGAPADPALATAAFTYDNALAIIALTACGEVPHAKRIGAALLSATLQSGPDGRLRNVYRAGAQKQLPMPPNGWWDAQANRWQEDAYQVGTATGNVAWAALALLTLADATGERRFVDGAIKLAQWAATHTWDARAPSGFGGGVHGFGPSPQVLAWKSTEHNIDLDALYGWLARVDKSYDWKTRAAQARGFVTAMWDSDHFLVGTKENGSVNHDQSGLDAQLWPLLLPDAPGAWRQSLIYARRAHFIDGGFDFNSDRDGVWMEGTAQAALAERVVGHAAESRALLARVMREIAPSGYLWATSVKRLSTGLAIGPASASDDFAYFRQPHLGATSWAILAAQGWNPFTGRKLP